MSPKPRRESHVMVAATISRNPKLAALPSDTARLGYFYAVLGEAKLLRPAGRFASRGQWLEVAGRFAKFLPQYLASGLMEQAPALCKKCGPRWGDLPAGSLVVHDWHEHQVDPRGSSSFDGMEPQEVTPGAERTRWWRLRTIVFERDDYTCRYCGLQGDDRRRLLVDHVIPVREGRDDDLDNLVTACWSCNTKKGGRTPEEAGLVLLPSPVIRHGDTSQRSGDTSLVTDGDEPPWPDGDVSPHARRDHAREVERRTENVEGIRSSPVGANAHAPDQDDADPAFALRQWLATHNAPIRDGDGYHAKLVRMVATDLGKTCSDVIAAFERLRGEGAKTSKQYVMGAEDLLFPTLKPGSAKAPAVPPGKYDAMVEGGDDTSWIGGHTDG